MPDENGMVATFERHNAKTPCTVGELIGWLDQFATTDEVNLYISPTRGRKRAAPYLGVNTCQLQRATAAALKAWERYFAEAAKYEKWLRKRRKELQKLNKK